MKNPTDVNEHTMLLSNHDVDCVLVDFFVSVSCVVSCPAVLRWVWSLDRNYYILVRKIVVWLCNRLGDN